MARLTLPDATEGPDLDDIERMRIEHSCTRLVHEYSALVDHGRAAEIGDLFTSDGRFEAPGVEMNGSEELRAGFALRQDNRGRRSRHVCTNVTIDVTDPDHATGTVYLTLYRHDGDPEARLSPLVGPALVGEYHDRFRREPDGWRFASRRCTVEFLAEGSA